MRLNKQFKNSLYPVVMFFLIPVLYYGLRLLRLTWRVRRLNAENSVLRPLIVALPHCEIIVGASELVHHRNAAVLSSPSRDGQVSAAVVRRFGGRTLFGSSNKNPVAAMRHVIDALHNEKMFVIVTFDGPRGPALHVKPGLVFAAAVTQTPILVGVSKCNNCWCMKSWDSTKIPKPFAHIDLIYGDLIAPPANTEREEIERVRLLVQKQVEAMYLANSTV